MRELDKSHAPKATVQLFFAVNFALQGPEFAARLTGELVVMVGRGGEQDTANSGLTSVGVDSPPEQANAAGTSDDASKARNRRAWRITRTFQVQGAAAFAAGDARRTA